MADKNELKKDGQKSSAGFQIRINKFGQVEHNKNIEDLNQFLNENVEDKKLVGRKDLKMTPDHKKN